MLSSCMMDAPARLVREYKQEKRHECSAFSHQRFLCADLCAENYLQILVDYWKFAAKIVVDWKFLKRSDLVRISVCMLPDEELIYRLHRFVILCCFSRCCNKYKKHAYLYFLVPQQQHYYFISNPIYQLDYLFCKK